MGLDFQHYNGASGQYYLPEIMGAGAALLDFDNDGDPNQLWINQRNGAFKNEALLGGAAVNRDGLAEAGMGVDAGDFDGDEDIFVTHLMEETNTLFVNLGNGLFEDRTPQAGLALQSRRYTGFGALWFDYDNDGWLDLLVTNGAVRILQDQARQRNPFPFAQPNQLFRNTGQGGFSDVSTAAGPAFNLAAVGRGAAFGDLDNDGDTDALIANNNGRARLFLNQVGARNHWLGLRLVTGKRDALGARVEIRVTKNQTLWRRAHRWRLLFRARPQGARRSGPGRARRSGARPLAIGQDRRVEKPAGQSVYHASGRRVASDKVRTDDYDCWFLAALGLLFSLAWADGRAS